MSTNVIQPSFNGFSLQDNNWITERIEWKGLPKIDLYTQPIARREGIKVTGKTEREKSVVLSGVVVAPDSGTLQSLLDNAKAALIQQEGALVIELGRQFTATVSDNKVPDQAFNQSIAQWELTFTTNDPFAIAAQVSAVIPVPSGVFTVSGMVLISGSYFNRPTLIYTPPNPPAAGDTNIKSVTAFHVPTGQSVTVSGFGGGTDLQYNSNVTINMDTFQTLDNTTPLNNSGAFPKWQPGFNSFTVSCDHGFPGGTITVQYTPRYL